VKLKLLWGLVLEQGFEIGNPEGLGSTLPVGSLGNTVWVGHVEDLESQLSYRLIHI